MAGNAPKRERVPLSPIIYRYSLFLWVGRQAAGRPGGHGQRRGEWREGATFPRGGRRWRLPPYGFAPRFQFFFCFFFFLKATTRPAVRGAPGYPAPGGGGGGSEEAEGRGVRKNRKIKDKKTKIQTKRCETVRSSGFPNGLCPQVPGFLFYFFKSPPRPAAHGGPGRGGGVASTGQAKAPGGKKASQKKSQKTRQRKSKNATS